VLSTVAANHTAGLPSDGNGLTSSLLGGYHVAFLVGALAIVAGIVLAMALLRPRDPQLAVDSVDRIPARLTMEEQAA
jgi:hypothetical protein